MKRYAKKNLIKQLNIIRLVGLYGHATKKSNAAYLQLPENVRKYDKERIVYD